jgi:hypothetical protein
MQESPLTMDSLIEHYQASVDTLVEGQNYLYSVLLGANRRFTLEKMYPQHKYLTGKMDGREAVILRWFVQTRTWCLASSQSDTTVGIGKTCDGLVVRTIADNVIGRKMVPGAALPSTDLAMINAVPVDAGSAPVQTPFD